MSAQEAARQSRERARQASEYVRYVRRLLGQAMMDESQALQAARDAEQAAQR